MRTRAFRAFGCLLLLVAALPSLGQYSYTGAGMTIPPPTPPPASHQAPEPAQTFISGKITKQSNDCREATLMDKVNKCAAEFNPLGIAGVIGETFDKRMACILNAGNGLAGLVEVKRPGFQTVREVCEEGHVTWIDTFVQGMIDGLAGLLNVLVKTLPELLWYGPGWLAARGGDTLGWTAERAQEGWDQFMSPKEKQERWNYTMWFLSNPQKATAQAMQSAHTAGSNTIHVVGDMQSWIKAGQYLWSGGQKILSPLVDEFLHYLNDKSCEAYTRKAYPVSCSPESANCVCAAVADVKGNLKTMDLFKREGIDPIPVGPKRAMKFCINQTHTRLACAKPFPGFDVACPDCEALQRMMTGVAGNLASFIVPTMAMARMSGFIGVAKQMQITSDISLKARMAAETALDATVRSDMAQALAKSAAGKAVAKVGTPLVNAGVKVGTHVVKPLAKGLWNLAGYPFVKPYQLLYGQIDEAFARAQLLYGQQDAVRLFNRLGLMRQMSRIGSAASNVDKEFLSLKALNLKGHVSQEELRASWGNIMKESHPDKWPHPIEPPVVPEPAPGASRAAWEAYHQYSYVDFPHYLEQKAVAQWHAKRTLDANDAYGFLKKSWFNAK